MYSSLRYIKEAAPPAPIPGQPLLASFSELESQNPAPPNAGPAAPPNPNAITQTASSTTHQDPNASNANITQASQTSRQEAFAKDIRELSKDIVIKEQQIETLIANLPGLRTTEEEQVARMRELEKELQEMEGERVEAVQEKERLVARVEEILGGVDGIQ
jgi:mediator of RNA polymerase II transcription subunit 21